MCEGSEAYNLQPIDRCIINSVDPYASIYIFIQVGVTENANKNILLHIVINIIAPD